MNFSEKPLNEILNIPTEPKEVEIIEPSKLSLSEIEAEEDKERLKKEEEQFNRDFENARRNMLFVIDGAKDSLEKISRIAEDKETAREFDALNNLLRTIGDSSSVLLNLHERRKKYRERSIGGRSVDSTTNINNAVFVGNSSEFKDLIKKLKTENN